MRTAVHGGTARTSPIRYAIGKCFAYDTGCFLHICGAFLPVGHAFQVSLVLAEYSQPSCSVTGTHIESKVSQIPQNRE